MTNVRLRPSRHVWGYRKGPEDLARYKLDVTGTIYGTAYIEASSPEEARAILKPEHVDIHEVVLTKVLVIDIEPA